MGKTQVKAKAQAEQMSPAALKVMGTMTTSGTFNGAAVIDSFQGNLMGKEVGFELAHQSLGERVNAIQAGDLKLLESMLFSQASALQTIFASLARRASTQEHLAQYQAFLGLALKAQAQSRATIEALVELKQPRQQPTFIKQANVAAGHQQVNNTYASASACTTDASHAEKNAGPQTELLEASDEQRLDTRTKGKAGGANPQLVPVGEVNGATQR